MMERNCKTCVHGAAPASDGPCGVCIMLTTKGENRWPHYEPKPQKPQTNGDHIRGMTDEELAEWIRNGIASDACDYCNYNNGYCDGSPCRGKAEADVIIDWLQQPYEEDYNG